MIEEAQRIEPKIKAALNGEFVAGALREGVGGFQCR